MATDPLSPNRTPSAIEVRDVVRATDAESKVRLTATVVLGGVTIHYVKLIQGQRGVFVGMPSRKVDEQYVDVVELSEGLRTRVREALQDALHATPAEEVPDDLPF